ncbi:MAG: hypothetical protein ACOCWW_01200 [Bacteroidota bacterium]
MNNYQINRRKKLRFMGVLMCLALLSSISFANVNKTVFLSASSVTQSDTLKIEPYYFRISLLSPAARFEMNLKNPAHSFYIEYSGYPGIPWTHSESTTTVWKSHIFTGYRYYFDLNRKIINNKKYFNHNAFYIGLYHRYSPGCDYEFIYEMVLNPLTFTSRDNNLGIGVDIGRQFTIERFYFNIGLCFEEKYKIDNSKLLYDQLIITPKLHIGWFFP